MLRASLPSAVLGEAPWSIFLSLYELLDEYPQHLIEVSLDCLLLLWELFLAPHSVFTVKYLSARAQLIRMTWQGPWKEQIKNLHPSSAGCVQKADQRCEKLQG